MLSRRRLEYKGSYTHLQETGVRERKEKLKLRVDQNQQIVIIALVLGMGSEGTVREVKDKMLWSMLPGSWSAIKKRSLSHLGVIRQLQNGIKLKAWLQGKQTHSMLKQ